MKYQSIIGETRYLVCNAKVRTIKVLRPYLENPCDEIYLCEDEDSEVLATPNEMFLTKEEAQKEADIQKERIQYMPRIFVTSKTQLIRKDINSKHSIHSVWIGSVDERGNITRYSRCRKKNGRNPEHFTLVNIIFIFIRERMTINGL